MMTGMLGARGGPSPFRISLFDLGTSGQPDPPKRPRFSVLKTPEGNKIVTHKDGDSAK